jgi:hypothetical protein
VPVPKSATTCGLLGASSLMVTNPVRVPVLVGAKVKAIVQLANAATGVEVEHVVLESSANSPLKLMAEIVNALVPVFASVTLCTALVVPTTWLPNVRLEGVRLTPGAVPVPERVTTLVPALLTKERLPLRVPVAVGVNVTPTAQLALGASGVETTQGVVAPSTAKSPLAVKLVKFRSLVPVFVTVTLWAAPVVPTTWLPKMSVAGERPTAGATPVPERLTTCGLPGASSVMLTAPVRVPVVVGVKVTLIVQFAPAAKFAPQVLVCAKSVL